MRGMLGAGREKQRERESEGGGGTERETHRQTKNERKDIYTLNDNLHKNMNQPAKNKQKT